MTEEYNNSKINYHSFKSILAFILFPPLWFLSVPAIIFSSEAKKFHKMGAGNLARYYAAKSDRFSSSVFLILLIIAGFSLVLILFILFGLV